MVISNVSIDGSNYFFLGDPQSSMLLGFAADTLAIKTDCQLATQNCSVDTGFSYGAYNVPSFSYSGEVGVAPMDATSDTGASTVGIQFFNDSGLSQPVGFGSNATGLFSVQNPLHFLAWSKGFPPADISSDEYAALRQGGYLKSDDSGDTVFVLSCSAIISEVKYYWVNGTISFNGLAAFKEAPDYYGAVFSAPFAIDSTVSHIALQDAALLAAFEREPEALAKVFADHFSRAALALSAGVFVQVANDEEWRRQLATRIPFAPLYTLIALKALYALFALGLSVLAVLLTNPSEAQEVRMRLTLEGITAGFFESKTNQEMGVENVQDLFEEHKRPGKRDDTKRVGLHRTSQGGWLWVDVTQKVVEGLGTQETMKSVSDQGCNASERQRETVAHEAKDIN
jgi:hypothetical protein